MITALGIILIVTPLLAIQKLLLAITWALPPEVTSALTQFFSYIAYWNGILPLFPDPTSTGLHRTVGIVTIASWSLTITLAIYLLKLFLFVLRMLPFLHIEPDHRDIIRSRHK